MRCQYPAGDYGVCGRRAVWWVEWHQYRDGSADPVDLAMSCCEEHARALPAVRRTPLGEETGDSRPAKRGGR